MNGGAGAVWTRRNWQGADIRPGSMSKAKTQGGCLGTWDTPPTPPESMPEMGRHRLTNVPAQSPPTFLRLGANREVYWRKPQTRATEDAVTESGES